MGNTLSMVLLLGLLLLLTIAPFSALSLLMMVMVLSVTLWIGSTLLQAALGNSRSEDPG